MSRAYRRWAAAVMLATAAVNVAVLPFLPARAQPVRWRGEADLRNLVFTERSSVDLRFGLYEDIRFVLRGGVLVVPPNSIVEPYIARGLAEVTAEIRDYDPAIDTSSLPDPILDGSNDGTGEVVEYVVLPGSGDLWWLGVDGDKVVILADSLVPVPEASDG